MHARGTISWPMVAVFCLLFSGALQAREHAFKTLPDSAWQVLAHARGVIVGGTADASIQVVFDVNSPYGAKYFKRLQDSYPDTAVRWVPVAYIHGDSASIATAILASSDPVASLQRNFEQYDAGSQHGGYPLSGDDSKVSLKSFQPQVRQRWIKNWGGYTPITIFRTAKGRVLKADGLLDKATFARIVSLTAAARKPDSGADDSTSAASEQAGDSTFAAMCKQYPQGVRRAGCQQYMGRQFGFVRQMQRHTHAPPQKIARIVAIISLQSVLALDTTVRYWNSLGQWAWKTGADRENFHTFKSALAGGGQAHAPQPMTCPGGGTIGLVNNGGGAKALKQQHTLPSVEVGFADGCRAADGASSVTAAAPKTPYATQFSVPGRIDKQLLTHPMYVLFNSQPRLASMPAWVPQGPLGEIRNTKGHLQVYADTRKQNQSHFGFTIWPKHAHFVKHKPYAGLGFQAEPSTPGVGQANCSSDGHRCLMLDTDIAGPDHVSAHFDLAGSVRTSVQQPPRALYLFKIGVNTTQDLDFDHSKAQPRLMAGHVVLHAGFAGPDNPELEPHWRIEIEPRMSQGAAMLAVSWQHQENGKLDKGQFTMAQAGNLSLPHYCGPDEHDWDCVDPAYYPDYERKTTH